MKKIKYLIILVLLYIINIPDIYAATFLNSTNNNPVVGTSFDIKFNLEYGHDARVAEGHYKITYDSSCFEYPRKIFVAYADRRICLIVFQQNVVFRLIPLDKVVLQQKSVFFCLYDDVSDIFYFADKHPCLCALLVFIEIRRDSTL